MSDLPIQILLPDIVATLQTRDEAVLEAPPGAGKTTLVPLALLELPGLTDRKILMLEPRRLAARAAAERMSALLGEPLGQTVGYRIRLESCVSDATRIEVITEGILNRMLLDDPSLENVGLVIFDEFHERNLDGDLGLALCLESRRVFSDLRVAPLKLLVMSATLDGERISKILGQAPVLRSEGRQYPVEVKYSGRASSGISQRDIAERVASTVLEAWRDNVGSILVFLPGQAEIRRCQSLLQGQIDASTEIFPLYGNLSLAEQRRAVQAAPPGQRKIVLATSLAESSLTIEGVSVVVDSGLQRQSRFDPGTAMNRLFTGRVSKASATQRSGRAGRLQEGVCYRLWSEAEQQGLADYADAEILQADLAPLLLQVLRWGVSDPTELLWLDSPPQAHIDQAMALLERLGGIDAPGKLSRHGEEMAALPMHPRLSHMLLRAAAYGEQSARTACELAALIGERDISSDSDNSDIERSLEILRGERVVPKAIKPVVQRLQKQCEQYRRVLPSVSRNVSGEGEELTMAEILCFAYPDRIARQLKAGSLDYQLANGRRASLRAGDPLCNSPWLVVAESGGVLGRSQDVIYRAAALDDEAFSSTLQELCEELIFSDWDDSKQRFIAERQWCVGALVWRRQALDSIPLEKKDEVLIGLVRQRGLAVLNWTEAALQLRARVNLLRDVQPDCGLPDFTESGLISSLEEWLQPYLAPVKTLTDLGRVDCEKILLGQLGWQGRNKIDQLLPSAITVPSGSKIAIDYCQTPPVLAVKLQEMFGCENTPTVADGRVSLMVHLLSPARRPLQITQDLAGFWRGSYQQVKKEMKGRYPKHPWPDDPLVALPTARTKARM